MKFSENLMGKPCATPVRAQEASMGNLHSLKPATMRWYTRASAGQLPIVGDRVFFYPSRAIRVSLGEQKQCKVGAVNDFLPVSYVIRDCYGAKLRTHISKSLFSKITDET